MSINFIRERPVSISVARKTLIPAIDGRPISPATAYRWIDRGVLTGDGCRVRLEAVRIGRALATTKEAVDRFLDEVSRRSSARTETKLPANVESELVAAGLMSSENDDARQTAGVPRVVRISRLGSVRPNAR